MNDQYLMRKSFVSAAAALARSLASPPNLMKGYRHSIYHQKLLCTDNVSGINCFSNAKIDLFSITETKLPSHIIRGCCRAPSVGTSKASRRGRVNVQVAPFNK